MNIGLLALISFFITFVFFIPFINLLYKFKLEDPNPSKHKDVFGESTPIFKKLRAGTSGTPIGGGLLIVLVVSLLTVLYFIIFDKLDIRIAGILVTFISFMILGLFDDLKKTFHFKGGPFELRVRQKFLLQAVIGIAICYWLSVNGVIKISIPGIFNVENVYLLTALSSFFMVYMLNAFNITDGVDGLSSGTLIIALVAILYFSTSIMDSTVTVFTSLLLGSLISYLYFNIHPARLLMGDTGSLAFGSVLTLLMFMTDTFYLLPIVGFIYIVEGLSSLLQWGYRRFKGKKLFDAAPLHYHLENRGWPQTKVTMRAYIAQAVLILIAIAIFSF